MAKIAFDYESIKNRVLQNLSAQSEWASFLDYGVIDNIISSVVNEMSYQIQYAEYNTVENFWNMARNRSSLLQMSPMHGYIVPRKQSSTGTVRISTSSTFDSSYSKTIAIPKFFQFSGNGIYVCSENDTQLNPTENYVEVSCIQGEVKEVSFLAEGIQYEEKIIYDDSVENSFFVLTVNDIEWTQVDSLFSCESTEQCYQIRTLPNLSGITIRFGNDVFGKKLNKNDVVKFKYISTDGADGNIYTSDVITSVESQAFDSSGYSVKLYCTNVTSFVGGKDYPSIEEIREISPNVYQTGDRASSRSDYITILQKMSDLSKISVWGAYETLIDNNEDPWGFISAEQNVVHLALLLGDEYDSFDDLEEIDPEYVTLKKTKIIESLHDVNDPTDLISFESTNKIPMVFHIDGTITSSAYTTNEVSNNIKTNLSKTYGIKSMEFGESVYNSDYIRLIDETDGVKNHISYIELYKDNIKLSSDYYCDFNLPIYPISYDSVKVYVKNTTIEDSDYELMATCDSNGNIIGAEDTSYVTTNSSINLNSGNGALNITNGLTDDYRNYSFKIEYQYFDKNLKNSSRKNILYYDDAVINLGY
jgi:hypothetical protein